MLRLHAFVIFTAVLATPVFAQEPRSQGGDQSWGSSSEIAYPVVGDNQCNYATGPVYRYQSLEPLPIDNHCGEGYYCPPEPSGLKRYIKIFYGAGSYYPETISISEPVDCALEGENCVESGGNYDPVTKSCTCPAGRVLEGEHISGYCKLQSLIDGDLKLIMEEGNAVIDEMDQGVPMPRSPEMK